MNRRQEMVQFVMTSLTEAELLRLRTKIEDGIGQLRDDPNWAQPNPAHGLCSNTVKRELRKRFSNGATQKVMAERCRISETYLNAFFCDRCPPPAAVLDFLGLEACTGYRWRDQA